MKPETSFRINKVIPFLDTLINTAYFPIQQKAIRGDADFMLCTQGHFVWLELKSESGKLQPLQNYKAIKVKRCGGITIEASPNNWDAVKAALQFLDKGEIVWDKRLHLRTECFYSIINSGGN